MKDEERVLACDRWGLVEHNLRAIAKHIESIRGQARWGVGSLEQSFRGYTALPADDEKRPWKVVLGLHPGIEPNRETIQRYYRRAASDCHPDRGGSNEAFAELALARKRGLAALEGRAE